MQFSIISSENLSFIYNLNTNERIPAAICKYTDKNKTSHYYVEYPSSETDWKACL